ncbi:MAG TPA: GreA/GreB family elongation factor [Casimicrobiaceae bacterium]|nr:GreA/GreB family elongation factor [Casimicrobiaceae bacterium]
MFDLHDVTLSSRDAAALAALVTDWPARDASEQAAADVIADTVAAARVVADRSLAVDTVSLGTTVTYDELPAGTRRTVTLVHPAGADPSRARVSVLRPAARALLGRRAGMGVPASVPDRSIRELAIVAISRDGGRDAH